nr:hypothetical protein [Morchella crassipes]
MTFGGDSSTNNISDKGPNGTTLYMNGAGGGSSDSPLAANSSSSVLPLEGKSNNYSREQIMRSIEESREPNKFLSENEDVKQILPASLLKPELFNTLKIYPGENEEIIRIKVKFNQWLNEQGEILERLKEENLELKRYGYHLYLYLCEVYGLPSDKESERLKPFGGSHYLKTILESKKQEFSKNGDTIILMCESIEKTRKEIQGIIAKEMLEIQKRENIKSEYIKSVNIKSENIKSENFPIKSENIKSENIKSENIKSEYIKSENIKSEYIKSVKIKSENIE